MSKATKKAKAWFRRPDLVTEEVQIDFDFPTNFVDVGEIVSIVYRSHKFDGKPRTYEHEFTKVRRLLIAEDGSCFIIDPKPKITTRGIEG